MTTQTISTGRLARAITWQASKQTYWTVRLLVDRGLEDLAFCTYAYFRWVDDRLDAQSAGMQERIDFVERQKSLMKSLYGGSEPDDLTSEEAMLRDLIKYDPDPASGLGRYIHHMMEVMVFDTYRRGRIVSRKELDNYSLHLATAVTEAMHYFIGHEGYAPHDSTRYHAVLGAHIAHMLRDSRPDTTGGYINIEEEYLTSHSLQIDNFGSQAYRDWVQSRVALCRRLFQSGEGYLLQVQSLRCRLAGFAYLARFRSVLSCIEESGYLLKDSYEECKGPLSALGMLQSVVRLLFQSTRRSSPRLSQET